MNTDKTVYSVCNLDCQGCFCRVEGGRLRVQYTAIITLNDATLAKEIETDVPTTKHKFGLNVTCFKWSGLSKKRATHFKTLSMQINRCFVRFFNVVMWLGQVNLGIRLGLLMLR